MGLRSRGKGPRERNRTRECVRASVRGRRRLRSSGFTRKLSATEGGSQQDAGL